MLTRALRFFNYFTVQSNVLVALSVLPLLRYPATDERAWRVLRLDALIGISVTGVVFVVALRPIVDLTGISAATNVGFDYLSPLLAVVGWLLFGPRPRIGGSTLGWALAWLSELSFSWRIPGCRRNRRSWRTRTSGFRIDTKGGM